MRGHRDRAAAPVPGQAGHLEGSWHLADGQARWTPALPTRRPAAAAAPTELLAAAAAAVTVPVRANCPACPCAMAVAAPSHIWAACRG
eukprot:scaffold11731_cov119-Isochrysis_galbana.AAC.1